MKILPRSLFSRLMIIFLVGLVLAQGISLTVMLQDRGEYLSRASGIQSVRRIADTVIVFDAASESERTRLVKLLSSPMMRISITPQRPKLSTDRVSQETTDSRQTVMFSSILQRALGREREMQLVVLDRSSVRPHRPQSSTAAQGQHHSHMGVFVVAQIRLQDGNWAIFDSQLQPEATSWPYRVLISLLVLLFAVFMLAIVGVRWVTRPLKKFAEAATEIGKNIDRPPLPETGPLEVAQAARALNGMQFRLSRYLQDRTRILAAMSHDLKTPITRMRLRAELLDDEIMKEKFAKDLIELESMVSGTLDFMRGLEGTETLQRIEVMALLESLQADAQELNQRVELLGCAAEPFLCRPQALKRCLSNLIENAVKYGDNAYVDCTQSQDSLHIVISDDGPGVSSHELERLFDPFYRLESSRNRAHGGSGLGLTIARSIAEQHGGTLILKNGKDKGLECHLDLPIKR